MCNERKKNLITNKKRKKIFNKIFKIWIKLVDKYFTLKNLIKSIKICIFLNIKRFFINYKIFNRIILNFIVFLRINFFN